jgi:cytoskeletal protein CcmA (bactofilin family)
MGFFKDFKDDFSQAVNELVPGEENQDLLDTTDDIEINTLEGDVDVESELSKLDGLLEQVSRQDRSHETDEPAVAEPDKAVEEAKEPEVPQQEEKITTTHEDTNAAEEVNTMADITYAQNSAAEQAIAEPEKFISDEVSTITEGTVIKGDIVSNGSLDIKGQVNGNVSCNGKLTVTGVVNGNSSTSEFFADSAQVEGEVVSSGTVKIGLGSVVIGNLSSTSAVIAGAIKGDIDVKGPVVVDTSAVVMGNIKSRSVQINNGAVIEGFCSQCYSDIDMDSLFESKKGSKR